jgi:hypothetical protein
MRRRTDARDDDQPSAHGGWRAAARALLRRPLALFYLGSAALALPDLIWNVNIRCAFWSNHDALHWIYYGGCCVLGMVALRAPRRLAADLALAETSFNLLMIVLALLAPLYTLQASAARGTLTAPPYGLGFVVNAALSSAVFLRLFYTNPLLAHARRRDTVRTGSQRSPASARPIAPTPDLTGGNAPASVAAQFRIRWPRPR